MSMAAITTSDTPATALMLTREAHRGQCYDLGRATIDRLYGDGHRTNPRA